MPFFRWWARGKYSLSFFFILRMIWRDACVCLIQRYFTSRKNNTKDNGCRSKEGIQQFTNLKWMVSIRLYLSVTDTSKKVLQLKCAPPLGHGCDHTERFPLDPRCKYLCNFLCSSSRFIIYFCNFFFDFARQRATLGATMLLHKTRF